ncbi:BA14K family protein [Rhizobium sp. CF080]|uniref:BA14K family protein n=1 Tax=Rhizobium sp. (strain CF080) TaxID=1144310 RepID=UPI0003E80264|nr:BA14K family protein [Rhizobium sp. CF080]EUB94984.1 BA14K family protein [Rhizobium sp. CF080]
MKKKLAVVVLSLITAFSGVAPAQAFPSISAPRIEASQDIQQVQYRWRDRDRWEGRRYYRDRYYGDRHYRRRGSNAGAIIGGLALGAIIGGALAQPRYAPRYARRYYAPRRYVGGNAHVNWCYARYRSYRAYDNTFQPYYGPRQQCFSPY